MKNIRIPTVNMKTWSKLKLPLMSEVIHIRHRLLEPNGGHLLMLIFFIFTTAAPAQGSQSTCDAPPALSGSITTVTCIFSVNIIKSKVNVYIIHHFKDIIKDEIVLTCKYPNGTFNCSSIPDYQFVKYEEDSTTGKFKLIAQISKVNNRHTGKYCCAFSWLGDSRENQCQECILEMKVLAENLSTAENYTINGTTENKTKLETLPIAVALSIVMLLVTIGLVILIYVLCKRHRKKKMMATDKLNSQHLLIAKRNEPNKNHQAEESQKELI